MKANCGKKTKGAGKWWQDWDFKHRIRNTTLKNIPRRPPSRRSASRQSPNYAEECTGDEFLAPETTTMSQECPAYAFAPISEPSLPTPAPEVLSEDEFNSMTKACEELLEDFDSSGVTKTVKDDCTFENFELDPELAEDLWRWPYAEQELTLMNRSWRNAPQKEEHKFTYCAKIGAILGY